MKTEEGHRQSRTPTSERGSAPAQTVPDELAEATGLSSAATTTLLDRLEAKGFVRRIRGTADRRKVLVEMTELG